MRHNILTEGRCTPWSAALVWAISATFFFTLTACGSDDEDEFTPSPDVVDGWTDVPDSGDGDTTPTPDADATPPISYEELCNECAARDMDCPTTARFLAWNGQDGNISGAADGLCEPFPPSCEEYQDVADYVWTCTNMGVYDDYYVDDHCVLRIVGGGISLVLEGTGTGQPWRYHEPGSMSITFCDPAEEGDVCWKPCTGTPKE